MRTIFSNELPPDWRRHTLIKSVERDRSRRMALALERTLQRCSEIRAEYESHTVTLRENSEKEGLAAGIELFFSQLITMLDKYEKLQNERFNAFRDGLKEALGTSLHDPVIVDRIIHHLQEKCGHQKPIRIIIPKEVPLPEDVDISNYVFSDDNHITIQNDMDSIRFPGGTLCQEWLSQAEKETIEPGQKLTTLIPEVLSNIGQQLLAYSERRGFDYYTQEKEEY